MKTTKLVGFESITKGHSVNIIFYEPKRNRGKDAEAIWPIVYGKIQYKNDMLTVNMELLQGHCFYIKKMDVLCTRWECKGCKQIFRRNEDLTRHLRGEMYWRKNKNHLFRR